MGLGECTAAVFLRNLKKGWREVALPTVSFGYAWLGGINDWL